MLLDDYADKTLERPQELIVPTTYLAELHDTEVEEQCPQLWLQHVKYVVLVTCSVTYCLHVVELEPERHHLVVKVWTRFDKFNVKVRWHLA